MGAVVALKPKRAKSPNIENRKVLPKRKHLTPEEAERLIKAAGTVGRHSHRDRTLLLLAYRHGLRVSELVSLKWHQVDLKGATLTVHRLKNGVPSTHPLQGVTLRALRPLSRAGAAYVFMSERAAPLKPDVVRKIVQRAGELAKLPFPVHPHMLRHACGYKLANEGRDTRSIQHYLGHKNIQHTVRYTELSPHRFRDFWRD